MIVLRKDNTFANQALVKRVIATGGRPSTLTMMPTPSWTARVLEEPYPNYEFDDLYGSDYMADRVDLDPSM